MRIPRVFTIPATAPFLPALARGILDGKIVPGFAPRGRPEELASATIYLPTRRAARALAEVFLEETKSSALLLPRIVPLGDVDEDTLAFESFELDPLPPAVSGTERRLALAKLIAGFAQTDTGLLPASPASAIALADELAHLMDDFITAGKKFSEAQGAVKAELDDYWKRSREFLAIVDRAWDDFLRASGKMDAAARRDTLLAREAERLAAHQGGPVIAAGSTGTLPKVAELLRAIAQHESGAVVLPGLDQILEDEAFARIGSEENALPGHPQFGLKRLLARIGIHRDAVEALAEPAFQARERIFSLAFRPALERDSRIETSEATALDGITVIEAADAREEALSIAIALREALEQEKTAALVTPDRALARRVCAELSRWNIAIDDSAGIALAESEAGRFARLLVEAADRDAMPSTLLALLRHPFLSGRFSSQDIALLELAILRGLRPSGGAQRLVESIAAAQAEELHASDLRSRFTPEGWIRASETAAALQALLAPLMAESDGEKEFLRLAQAHRAALATALTDDAPEACDALFEALDALCDAGAVAPAMRLSDYSEAFPALIREHILRSPRDEEARLRILGPLEARMITAERVVLGGLCEGIWPPEAHTDSWLNRPMRKELGLDLPERRIGLSAHDFVQAGAAKEIFLVRSRKQAGVETIASRFLQRLAAVADETAWRQAKKNGDDYLSFARALEKAEPADAPPPPAPTPPLTARPTRFSVSDLRDLVRDPYSIYAKRILKLAPLDEIDEEPGLAGRGMLLHDILARFAQEHPTVLPENALEILRAIGREAFEPLREFPAAFAIWWPRFERIAVWFVEEEKKRRAQIRRIHSELRGKLDLRIGNSQFRITARADRIEENIDGSVAVLDYKTGTLPTYKEAILGFEPQLLLEAAIAKEGGFDGLPAFEKIAEVAPIKISGGQPPGEVCRFALSTHRDFKAVSEARGIAGPDHLNEAADAALAGAKRLLAAYADLSTGYPFAPRVQWQKDYNDYEHLARFKEWAEEDSDAS